jgi:very-short-patch-repair endonuclease
VRLVIVRSGLPEPTVGHTVIDTDGYFVGTPDLAYIPERIAIEYEGDGHRTDARVFRDDIARRELFEIAGWRVLRVTSDDLRDTVHLVERVRRLLAQRRFS